MFFVFALVIFGLTYGYVGIRLNGPLQLDSAWRWVVIGVLVLHFAAMFASFALIRSHGPGGWPQIVYWFAFGGMGLFSLVFAGLVMSDLGWGGARLLQRFVDMPLVPVDEGRRRFVLGALNLGILGLAGLGGWFGWKEARDIPAVKRVDVPVQGLPESLEGYRIAQISDVHVGPTISGDFVGGVVKELNTLKADLVAITGDLVDGRVKHLRPHVELLRDIESKDGTFFVTGNHEYYSDAEAWCAELKRIGITVLNNAHVVLTRDLAKILLAGVTDYRAHTILPAHRSDPAKAVEGAPDCDVRLLLAHQPKSCRAAEKHGFHLQLSGHTHGGQFFPWNTMVRFVHPFAKGLNRFGAGFVYVNQGTGYWGPPMRIGVPAEITLLTLRSGDID